MIASVHLADVGVRSALHLLRRAPSPSTTRGLRHANVAAAAPLRDSGLPAPQIGRVGLVAFWDDDGAVDDFMSEHPIGAALGGGWHVRLQPLRAWGSWPGLPGDLPTDRTVDHDGPAVVVTLGRLRLTQALRFFRASAQAERSAREADGMTWATALARPPFVATCSLWQDTRALATYAYGRREPAHSDAIEAGRTKPFHKESAFIRFRPYGSGGNLNGRNPLTDTMMTV
jgi:hypothetical protein